MAQHRRALVEHVQQNFSGTLSHEQAGEVVDVVLAGIVSLTRDNEPLILKRFGTFKMIHRRKSTTSNLRTGEPLEIPASTRLGFKASRS